MEIITQYVDELDPQERTAVELLLGRPLRGDERLILQVLDGDESGASTPDS